jgi:hypothetical protein
LERHLAIAGLAPSFPQTPGASEQDAGSFVFASAMSDGALLPSRLGAIPPKRRHAIAKVESEF